MRLSIFNFKLGFISSALLQTLFIMITYDMLARFQCIPANSGQNLLQENVIRIQNYVHQGITPEVVIVGSSLATRIQQDILPSNTYNLALSGGSVWTGLEVIKRSGKIPKIILLEANDPLVRDIDSSILNTIFHPISFHLQKLSPIFRDAYQPVGVLARYLKTRTKHNFVKDQKLPPAIYAQALNKSLTTLGTPFPGTQITETAKKLRSVINDMESQGAKIFLFEMPLDPKIVNTPAIHNFSLELHRQFEARYWLPTLPVSNFETSDGLHLVYSSAKTYTEALVRLIEMLDRKAN